VKQIVWPFDDPASIRPGQRATNGTRWPPSHTSAFAPRSPPVAEWPNRCTSAGYQTGPLSLVR
jgi:hypothetical protein